MAAQQKGEQWNIFKGVHGIANSIMAHKRAGQRLELAKQHEQLARDKFNHKVSQDAQKQENFNTVQTNIMKRHEDNKQTKKDALDNRKMEFKKTMSLQGAKLGAQMANNNAKNKETVKHHREQEKTSKDNAKSYAAYTGATIDNRDAQTNFTNTRNTIAQETAKANNPNIKFQERVSNPHVQDAINKSNNYASNDAHDYGNINR